MQGAKFQGVELPGVRAKISKDSSPRSALLGFHVSLEEGVIYHTIIPKPDFLL